MALRGGPSWVALRGRPSLWAVAFSMRGGNGEPPVQAFLTPSVIRPLELLFYGMFLLLIAGAFKILDHHKPSAVVGTLKLYLIH